MTQWVQGKDLMGGGGGNLGVIHNLFDFNLAWKLKMAARPVTCMPFSEWLKSEISKLSLLKSATWYGRNVPYMNLWKVFCELDVQDCSDHRTLYPINVQHTFCILIWFSLKPLNHMKVKYDEILSIKKPMGNWMDNSS